MSHPNPPQLDRTRLFFIGSLSIFMIGLGFSVRANITPDIQSELFDKLDLASSAAMVGQVLGAIFDRAKVGAAGSLEKLASLSGAELESVLRYASIESFQVVAFIPVILLPIFGLIWLRDRAKGGYKPVAITAEGTK